MSENDLRVYSKRLLDSFCHPEGVYRSGLCGIKHTDGQYYPSGFNPALSTHLDMNIGPHEKNDCAVVIAVALGDALSETVSEQFGLPSETEYFLVQTGGNAREDGTGASGKTYFELSGNPHLKLPKEIDHPQGLVHFIEKNRVALLKRMSTYSY